MNRRFTATGTEVKLTCNLFSKGGVQSLIDALEEYKKELPRYLHLFVKRLAEAGLKVAQSSLASAQGDSDRTYDLEIVDVSGTKVSMRIDFRGEDVLFWEYGAGIYYNNGKANPKAHEKGMGVGTYPNQTHAINPGFWWYKGEDGSTHFSLGTEAAMPMYNAWAEMVKRVDSIARGAFF